MLVDNVKESKLKARTFFRRAHSSFAEVGHLMGMWMSKTYEAELMTDTEKDLNESESARNKAKACELEFQKYCVEEGIESSCHIPREQGPDISIMTEIVFDKNSQLFARKPDGEERSDPVSEEDDNESTGGATGKLVVDIMLTML